MLLTLLCMVLVMISGCRSSTIYNVHDQSLLTNKSNHATEDVKKAIVRAGAGLGWNMDANSPGHILGSLNIREHMAQVDISYDKNKYSITYKNSTNLNYNPSEPATIHSNYNGWIQNLDRAIKSQLNNL